MANEFSDTNVTGTLRVNGIELSGPGFGALLQVVASLAGRGTGVVTSAGSPELKVAAESSPTMSVEVAPGAALIADVLTGLQAVETLAFTAPSGNPRIDLVRIGADGVVSVVTGTEAASPVAPTAGSGRLALATIHHRVGETSIKDSDDSSNGYITDVR